MGRFYLFFFEGRIEGRKTILFCRNRLIYCPVIGPHAFARKKASSSTIGDSVLELGKKKSDGFIGTSRPSRIVFWWCSRVYTVVCSHEGCFREAS